MVVGAIFDAFRAMSAVKKHNAQIAKDKAKGLRQDEDFARVHFRSRKNPGRPSGAGQLCNSTGHLSNEARGHQDGREPSRP